MYYGYYHEQNQRLLKKSKKENSKNSKPIYVRFAHIVDIAVAQGWITQPTPFFFDNRKGERVYDRAQKNYLGRSCYPVYRTPGFGNKEYGKNGIIFNKVATNGRETIVNKRFI